VPTLVIGGESHVLQHPTQAAMLLGVETPPALRDAWRVAWDIDTIAQAWLEVAQRTRWTALLEPTPLGRTPLALAVDALVGVAALTDAIDSGWFHWPGNPLTGETGDEHVVEYERSIVATIATRDDLIAFARPAAAAWRAVVVKHEEALRCDSARPVDAPRGTLTLVELLEAQRLHAAQHYRQATVSLAAHGEPVPELDFRDFVDLRLPREVY
jgi:hypothetical protein